LTRSTSQDWQDRCRVVGIDLLFFKPVEMDLLLGALRRLGTVLDEYLAFDPVI